MPTQTLAIFHDAYRELNAKKMFWITMILSGVVVLIFAAVGVDNQKVTLVGKQLPIPIFSTRAEFYRGMFTTLGVAVWLSFAATILALISTASIFPDFISGGSIDLYLSKPISRLRLFVTKYLAGLLFVSLQVLVFSAASFLVIGIRGGAWEPGVFMAVPIVVCFFSYLYCVSTLVGVLTRSTIAAILLTVLAWGSMYVVGIGEVGLFVFKTAADREAASVEPTLKVVNGQITAIEQSPPENREASNEILDHLRTQRAELETQQANTSRRNLTIAHNLLYAVKTTLPKTSETIGLLNRQLLSPETRDDEDVEHDEQARDGDASQPPVGPRQRRRRDNGPISKADENVLKRELATRPVRWIVGTSLGFEAVVLCLAAWVFCRRDY